MITKLSRKVIKMLESSAKNDVSKCALEEYLSAHKKAETAWEVFRDSLILSEGSSEDSASKEMKSEKVRKFKAGDKVRVLDTENSVATTGIKVGYITEVLAYMENRLTVLVRSPYKTGCAYFEESALELVEEKTPNELRAEVIQRAKEFIENTKTKEFTGRVRTGLGLPEEGQRNTYYDVYVFGGEFKKVCNVEFIVHQEKRTVVALLRGVTTKKVYSKGIAKCNPDDVCNEHIGKAIALGRALGKDVSEFENAVQPTKVVQGQVIAWKLDEEKALYRIDNKTRNQFNFTEVKSNEKHHNYEYREIEKYTNIVDDTNAQYGVGDE